MMDMALLARTRHHERIAHALGPRPEPYGSTTRRPAQHSSPMWSRLAHLVHVPALILPPIPSRKA
jgi:hypothetical protein